MGAKSADAGQTECRLRLFSFNIQAGTNTNQYSEYLTKGWSHLLPSRERLKNLDQLAQTIGKYDFVGVQEADAGSLRSGYLNQTQYLAEKSGFHYWNHQSNRRVANVAHVSNGLLSRYEPQRIEDHKLPGRFPGRGALLAHFGTGDNQLTLAVIHLSLGKQSRKSQFNYLSEILAPYKNLVVMGDANCSMQSGEMDGFLRMTGLAEPLDHLKTFPAWRPEKDIDHILVSHHIQVERYEVIDLQLSDHLPVAMEISVPEHCMRDTLSNNGELSDFAEDSN